MKQAGWLDLTVPVKDGMMTWPSDPPVKVSAVKAVAKGGSSNVSLLEMGSHTGTHIDAPRHFIEQGATVDRLSVADMLGRVRVVRCAGSPMVGAQELRKLVLRRGERVFLRTRNSDSRWWEEPFRCDFVALSLEASRFLADRRIRMLGIDYLSVGGYRSPDGAEVHRTLLQAGIIVVEGLNLSAVRPGRYDLVCLPLKLAGGDGSPARVVLRGCRQAGRRAG